MNRKFVLAYPGNLETLTGGYIYDRTVFRELTELGWDGNLLPLGDGFPTPDFATLKNAGNLIEAQNPEMPILADCLAWGIMDRCAVKLANSHRIVPLVHHPLCLESGISDKHADELKSKEKITLSNCKCLVTTSRQTARSLHELFGIRNETIIVAEPGLNKAEPAVGRSDGKVGLLSVGSVIKRKRYDLLVTILKSMENLPWQLDIVGEVELQPDCVQELRKLVAVTELENRITIHGPLSPEQLSQLYHRSDLFVSTTHYEGYGMAFAEAMVRGIPIVTTGSGAVSHTVPREAGFVIEPVHLDTYKMTLEKMILNAKLRMRFGKGARKAAETIGSWTETAKKISTALEWK